VAVKICK